MSMTSNGGQDDRPSIAVLAQYVKDLSFENPNAPQLARPTSEQQPNYRYPDQCRGANNVATMPDYRSDTARSWKARPRTTVWSCSASNWPMPASSGIQNIPQADNLHPVGS